jgi:hypothetical protein
MPMKVSLALGPRETLSRQTAWGCLSTNLALPGFGSLMAGRASGYPQVALGLGGLVLTLLFTLRFAYWYFTSGSRLQGVETDPVEALIELWRAARWPLLGIGVFAAGWLWALATSCQILHAAKDAEPKNVPPLLS